MKYSDALKILDSGRKQDSKIIANNTRLIRHANYIGVQLHDTEVVKIYPDHYALFTGGWYTVTTKSRLNEFSPAYLRQESGRWYIGRWNEPNTSLFYEGMKVDIYGHPLHIKKLTIKADKAAKTLKAKIARYVKLCGVELSKGLPVPSGGDCWYCAMNTQENKTLGDATGNHEHLLDHMKEGYVVPSLLLNAVVEAGYKFPAVILGVSTAHKTMGASYAYIGGVTNSVRKYLNKRLLPMGVIGKSDNHSTGYAR